MLSMKLFDISHYARVDVTEIKRAVRPAGGDEFPFKSSEKEGQLFNQVAKTVLPSVVYIQAIVDMEMPNDGNHDFWDNFRPTPRAQTVGSGVIISKDGYIITNNHVIEGAIDGQVSVALNDNRTLVGDIVGRDPSTDIAVVKVRADDELPAVVFANSETVEVGDWVLAVGNPFRLRSTVTAGIVSAMSRNVDIIADNMRIENFIQTDAAINKGNSGGALVNINSELIGINTAIATESGGYEGYGFAVPANLALKVARDIIEFGEVKRAFLGVQIQTVTSERANDVNLPQIAGVEIVNIVDEGAASKANLFEGDIILGVNKTPIQTFNELQAKIAEFRPGDEVRLTIWRENKLQEEKITLKGEEQFAVAENNAQETLDLDEERRGDSEAESDPNPDGFDENPRNQNPHNFEPLEGIESFQNEELGFNITGVKNPENAEVFDMYVTYVKPKSAAAQSGLDAGDKVLGLNDDEVKTVEELKSKIEKHLDDDTPILLEVMKKDRSTTFYEIQP